MSGVLSALTLTDRKLETSKAPVWGSLKLAVLKRKIKAAEAQAAEVEKSQAKAEADYALLNPHPYHISVLTMEYNGLVSARRMQLRQG